MTVNGHNEDVSMTADGSVVRVQEQVALDALPPAVKSGLQTKAGDGKTLKVESLTKRDKLVAPRPPSPHSPVAARFSIRMALRCQGMRILALRCGCVRCAEGGLEERGRSRVEPGNSLCAARPEHRGFTKLPKPCTTFSNAGLSPRIYALVSVFFLSVLFIFVFLAAFAATNPPSISR